MSDTPGPADPARRGGRGRLSLALDRRSLREVITVLIAACALILSGWSLWRSGSASDDYSDAQSGDAKTKVCSAFDVVRRGVKLNTNLSVPGGPENIAASLGVAANARLSAYVGGLFILERLDPATPKDLASEMREFADLLTDIGAAATAGAPDKDPAQAARLKEADAANNRLGELCKK